MTDTTTIQFLADVPPYGPHDVASIASDRAAGYIAAGQAKAYVAPPPVVPEPEVLCFFHWQAPGAFGGILALPGDSKAYPASQAADLVLRGYATTDVLTRVRFTSRATIAAPSLFAGIYDPGATPYVFDAATAAGLVTAGEAEVAMPNARP